MMKARVTGEKHSSPMVCKKNVITIQIQVQVLVRGVRGVDVLDARVGVAPQRMRYRCGLSWSVRRGLLTAPGRGVGPGCVLPPPHPVRMSKNRGMQGAQGCSTDVTSGPCPVGSGTRDPLHAGGITQHIVRQWRLGDVPRALMTEWESGMAGDSSDVSTAGPAAASTPPRVSPPGAHSPEGHIPASPRTTPVWVGSPTRRAMQRCVLVNQFLCLATAGGAGRGELSALRTALGDVWRRHR